MGAINPYNGPSNVDLGMPKRWESVTPHATNYLDGDAENHYVAVVLYTPEGGAISFVQANGDTRTMTFTPGLMLPGAFVRVLLEGTDNIEIWAGFV